MIGSSLISALYFTASDFKEFLNLTLWYTRLIECVASNWLVLITVLSLDVSVFVCDLIVVVLVALVTNGNHIAQSLALTNRLSFNLSVAIVNGVF